jgi:molybdate transport system substrate-binding protein
MLSRKRLLVIVAAIGALWSAASYAEELHVITSGGFTEAYRILGPQFEAETGIVLVTEYGASSGGAPDSIPMRLARGEPADLIILARYALDDLTAAGYIFPGTRTDLVVSKIGMVVKDGELHPDISTRKAFIETLLNANSIAYSASASGSYLSSDLFPRLEIWDQLECKAMRVVSERVAAVVARGDAEIGFQQVSELLPIEGAEYVGELPEELQLVTLFSAGITTSVQNEAGASLLLQYLSSEEVAPTIAATGLDPVADN